MRLSWVLFWAYTFIKQPNYVCFSFETKPMSTAKNYSRNRRLWGFVWELGNTSWQFWITIDITALLTFLLMSCFISDLKNLGYFLNLKTKPIWKSFSTSCLVLCHKAPSLPLNLTALPSIKSIFPTGHNWLKVLKPWKLNPRGLN